MEAPISNLAAVRMTQRMTTAEADIAMLKAQLAALEEQLGSGEGSAQAGNAYAGGAAPLDFPVPYSNLESVSWTFGSAVNAALSITNTFTKAQLTEGNVDGWHVWTEGQQRVMQRAETQSWANQWVTYQIRTQELKGNLWIRVTDGNIGWGVVSNIEVLPN